jgi:membrane protein
MSDGKRSLTQDQAGVTHARESGHDIGRAARRPHQIPWRGWVEVLKRVVRKTSENSIGLVAAGVAFYALLAIFPAIGALISIYGLVSDPAQVDQQFAGTRGFMPNEVYTMISGQMRDVASHSGGALGTGLVAAIAVSLWSANKGTKSLIEALNIVYDEDEKRGFFRLNLLAITMTLFLVMLGVLAVAAVVALPVVLGFVGLGSVAEALMQWLRWPLLAAVVLLTLAVVYRYGPSRRMARWQWVTWGSGVAVVLWLAASGLFSFYVANFASYNATYGSLGAVIVMLMWLFLSAFIVLLGAEINAEMERQTAMDTTRNGDKPMGRRGAYVADNLPPESG